METPAQNNKTAESNKIPLLEPEKPLTAKQRRFVEEYPECLNATEAARRAGYSEKTARSIGAENLTKPDIALEIQRKVDVFGVTPPETLMRLSQIARASMEDFLSFDNGQPRLDLQKARDAGKLGLIRRITIGPNNEFRIELYDKLTALITLLKVHGELDNRIEKYLRKNLDLQKLSVEQCQRIGEGEDLLSVILNP